MSKMNPEWKEKWVEALRSGKYPQAHGTLRKKEGFCCLGVLSALTLGDDPTYEGLGAWNGEPVENYSFVPRATKKSADLSRDVQHTLVLMNDGRRSFNEIADWIEENL